MSPVTSLDHLIVGVGSLAEGVDRLAAATGVRASAGGRHPGWGTHNALASLGEGRYLELIARDPTASTGGTPLPFGLATVVDEPRLIGWAVRTEDIAGSVAAARERGYDPGEPIAMGRTTADGRTVAWRLTLNARDGGPVPFLIDWGATPHPSTVTPGGLRLTRFEVMHPDPASVREDLVALGVGVDVLSADTVGLRAEIAGPDGSILLG